MKIWLSIMFSSLFLVKSAAPQLCVELLKLPVLCEHYLEHAVRDNISIAEFLDTHYGDGEKAQDHLPDDDHHSQLPFHNSSPAPSATHIFAAPSNELQWAVPAVTIRSCFHGQRLNLPGSFADTPFQPPKA